jgi:hypothetical protein
MEQLESRALGRPKETVGHQGEEDPLRAEVLQIPQEERRAWLTQRSQGGRVLAHYLPRALHPAWIRRLRVDRLLSVHTHDPDPNPLKMGRFQCRAGGGGTPTAAQIAPGVPL